MVKLLSQRICGDPSLGLKRRLWSPVNPKRYEKVRIIYFNFHTIS